MSIVSEELEEPTPPELPSHSSPPIMASLPVPSSTFFTRPSKKSILNSLNSLSVVVSVRVVVVPDTVVLGAEAVVSTARLVVASTAPQAVAITALQVVVLMALPVEASVASTALVAQAVSAVALSCPTKNTQIVWLSFLALGTLSKVKYSKYKVQVPR